MKSSNTCICLAYPFSPPCWRYTVCVSLCVYLLQFQWISWQSLTESVYIFVDSPDLLSCVQGPTTGPCTDPDKYSSYPHSLFLYTYLMSSHLCLGFQRELFSLVDQNFVRIIHFARYVVSSCMMWYIQHFITTHYEASVLLKFLHHSLTSYFLGQPFFLTYLKSLFFP